METDIHRIHTPVTCVECGEVIEGTQYGTRDGFICEECQDKDFKK